MFYRLNILLVVLLGGPALAGVLDLFDVKTDYNAAFVMDSIYSVLVDDILKGDSTNPVEMDVIFWCGNRNSPNLSKVVINDTSLGAKIATSKPIAFITHGWLDNGDRHWIRAMAADYLQFVDSNVCVVDWKNLTLYGYATAVNHTFKVGAYMTKFITYLNGKGIPLGKVTLIGHSLGAQISGHTGYNLGGKIGTIYGLDPAGPLFTLPFDVGPAKRLDSSDAQYVQMIITSRCTAGVCIGDGHENFYPTGGFVPQPNCALPLFSNSESFEPISCSHSHANTLFQMALNPANVFLGKKCLSYPVYLAGLCLLNSSTKMGIYSSRIGGNFYLLTSPFAPFT
ncbi:pancreatic triacylglycerol lipase-like [Malaya genurostris]|uniref:pancreatic triacylglycerol lipase-like n=1 Tax=Malaya genurostris TaxID=325434 RepID=UPI0026F3CF7F|nr:pancreatic triacylglycerol lipase-like [Malaya genurostris]